MIVAIVLAVMLCVSLMSNFSQFLGGVALSGKTGRKAHRFLEEATIEQNRSRNKIAVLDVQGIIVSEPFGRSG